MRIFETGLYGSRLGGNHHVEGPVDILLWTMNKKKKV